VKKQQRICVVASVRAEPFLAIERENTREEQRARVVLRSISIRRASSRAGSLPDSARPDGLGETIWAA